MPGSKYMKSNKQCQLVTTRALKSLRPRLDRLTLNVAHLCFVLYRNLMAPLMTYDDMIKTCWSIINLNIYIYINTGCIPKFHGFEKCLEPLGDFLED